MAKVASRIHRGMQMMAVMHPDWKPQGSLFLVAPDASPLELDRTIGFGNLILKSAEEFATAGAMNEWLMTAYNQCDQHATTFLR